MNLSARNRGTENGDSCCMRHSFDRDVVKGNLQHIVGFEFVKIFNDESINVDSV